MSDGVWKGLASKSDIGNVRTGVGYGGARVPHTLLMIRMNGTKRQVRGTPVLGVRWQLMHIEQRPREWSFLTHGKNVNVILAF